MKKWYAECLDINNEIIHLSTRATTEENAINNLSVTYRLKAIMQIDDQRLFKTPYDSYIGSSLAQLV